MLTKPRLKAAWMIIAASIILAACTNHAGRAMTKAAASSWSISEVNHNTVRQVLSADADPGVLSIAEAKDILVQGANNKTITITLYPKNRMNPDQLMTSAAETLMSYSQILLDNKEIETVEICLLGNPVFDGKERRKELIRIAIARAAAQKIPEDRFIPLKTEDYPEVFKAASRYKINPLLYKSLQHKGDLKLKAYRK